VRNSKDNDYLKFTGLAFQLCGIIGLGVWSGYELDRKLENSIPWFTLALTFVSSVMAIFYLYKALTKDSN
jgi:F0F1-type ATP synthase assembly protein I